MRELTTTEHNLLTCTAALEEAQSEIKRHHELITKLRDYLRYVVEYPADFGGWDAKFEEMKEFLAREVA